MPLPIKLSIKQKLILIIMSISLVGFLLTCAGFIAYDIYTFKFDMVEDLNTLAKIIADNSTAAISFDDKESARELLSSLKDKTHITSAFILVNGYPIANYNRNNIQPVLPGLQTPGHLFYKDRLVFFQDIFLHDKKIGSLYIESDLDALNSRFKNYFTTIVIISPFVFIIIFFIVSMIQRTISDPILQLAQITKEVSRTENYSIEIKKQSNDEIGDLFDEFSKMMQKIQSRDMQLMHSKSDLEKRVEERTEELRKTLAKMKVAYEELRETQKQLLQSERMASIGQLAAGVAHEINNPVGFISNNMEILQGYVQNYTQILRVNEQIKTYVDNEDWTKVKSTLDELKKLEKEIDLDYMMNDVSKLLEHSNRGLERIRKIVLDLKTFAREDKTENVELIKVEEVIDGILSIVHNELKYKAELIKEYENSALVQGNAQRLGQVFINLLVNASQAIEERGKITIKTYLKDKHVCVDIIDTGKGVPEENLKKIFDPFFTTKPVGQGTGLGLSVSFEIIKKHGGDIQVKSKIGEGTTFTVRLPCYN